jgi:RES domain-containing protein
MNPKLVPALWVALGVIIAVPATGWMLATGAKDARQLSFRADGTDLKSTDVENAIRELHQKVKQVESSQAALQGAAML